MKFSKKLLVFLAFCAITSLWIYIIFSNSAKTGTESSKDSSALAALIDSVFAYFGWNIQVGESFLRALGHFLEYALLSLLFCADFAFFPTHTESKNFAYFLTVSPISLPLCFAISLVDEFAIQGSTPGRAPEWADVLTDSLGTLTSIALFLLLAHIVLGVRSKRKRLSAECTK